MLTSLLVGPHVAQAAGHDFGLHAHVQLLKCVGRHRVDLEFELGKAWVGLHGGHVAGTVFGGTRYRAVQPLGGHNDAPAQIQRQAKAVVLVAEMLRTIKRRVAVIKKDLVIHF